MSTFLIKEGKKILNYNCEESAQFKIAKLTRQLFLH